MKMRSLILAAFIGAVSAPSAYALASFSSTFGGVTFNINQVDSDSFDFQILNALTGGSNADGAGWTNITALAGFDFKGLGIDFSVSGVTATATYPYPAGTVYGGTNQQINANLCGSGQPSDSVCFGGGSFPGLNIALTDNVTFRLDFTNATLNFASAGPHLQIVFMAAQNCQEANSNAPYYDNNCKEGSLYSADIPTATSSSTSSSTGSGSGGASGNVPEPSSSALALLGIALLGGAMYRRQRTLKA